MIKFYRNKPLILEAFYSDLTSLPSPEAKIGEYKVQSIQPQENGEKAKVKVQVNTSGIVSVSSDTMVLRISSDKSETTDIDEICGHGGSDDIEIESKMIQQNCQEKERNNAKNAVEENVYYYRHNLEGPFQTFLNAQKLGLPVQNRYQESIRRPKMFEELSDKIQSYMTIVEEYKNGSYCHIDATDMDKVRMCVEDTQVWMTNIQDSQDKRRPDHDPAIHSTQIQAKSQALDNKPKPKPWVDSPMDDNIQPEWPHNKKSPEDMTMEYTDFVQNEAKINHVNI